MEKREIIEIANELCGCYNLYENDFEKAKNFVDVAIEELK